MLRGRLVLDDEVVVGRLAIEDGWIAAVDLEPDVDVAAARDLPYLAPGFVDVHVHGWGGHSAMGTARRSRRDGPGPPPPRRDVVPADGLVDATR